MIDIHCHILPGLDDGPATIEKSLEMCRIAAADGISAIVATPHMLNGMYAVSAEQVLAGAATLNDALDAEGLALRILPGADVHVDKDLPRYLSEKKVLTLADKGKHLMVELPQDVLPAEIADLLFQIQLKGVTPIVSHPERNVEVQRKPEILCGLVERGALLQVTAGSLTGAFGSRAEECGLGLLRRGMAHLVATDAHNAGRRPPRLSEARAVVERELGPEEARAVFEERPARLLAGAYVEPPEPLAAAGRVRGQSFILRTRSNPWRDALRRVRGMFR